MQSLWPDTTAQIPLSDVYFLRKVNLERYLNSVDEAEKMLFGTSKTSRQVLNDNGQRFEMYPDGFLSMLFIDLDDFDADTYRLTYLGPADLGEVSCFMFAVTPITTNTPGRFNGTIWVQKDSLRIVRTVGTFQYHRVGLRKRLGPLGASVRLFFSLRLLAREDNF